jgi:hypothetical protein
LCGPYTGIWECLVDLVEQNCSPGFDGRRDQAECNQAQLDACAPGCQAEPEPPPPPRR